MKTMTGYFLAVFTVIGTMSWGLPEHLNSAPNTPLSTNTPTPFDPNIETLPTPDLITLPDLDETLRKPSPTTTQAAQPETTEPTKPQPSFLYSLPTPSPNTPTQPVIHRQTTATTTNLNPRDSTTNTTDDSSSSNATDTSKTILINFNNVSIIEYIRFVSRISNKNFLFDENDLQFNVTIISEEPATIENIMTALLQELRIHDLSLIEEGNNFLIHKNAKVNSISKIVSSDEPSNNSGEAEIITQVFRLNTLDPERAATILKPLVSDAALIEVLKDSNHLIVTDLASNISKIAQLLKILDAPNSGVVIGQYVSKLAISTLIPLAQQIIQPISLDQTLTFVPQDVTNSVFIISSPYLVERTIAILQYLDQSRATTQILDLNELQVDKLLQNLSKENDLGGTWVQNPDGTWSFVPNTSRKGGNPPEGSWTQDADGNWHFNPKGTPGGPQPNGHWELDKDGNWVFKLDKDETFNPGVFKREFEGKPELPGGTKKITQFFIYKLQYRKGDVIEPLLRQIADTLQQNERGNEDLIAALRSVQWLSIPNSLVFSGTPESLERARALTIEMDFPTRQVFIEMLILETTLSDSLQYGVSYGTRFGGGNTSGSQSFFSSPTTPFVNAINTAGFSGLGGPATSLVQLVPDGTRLNNSPGFNIGVIGQKITHCGTEFGSIGALVNALHDRTKDKVVSNPKLLVEDNSPAEIFVGINTPYRTQSISNDIGSVITSNYIYQDVGTRLKVTPYLGNGDIIAIDLEEEVSTIVDGLITDASTASSSPGPTTRINRTTTRVHIPDTYFLVISGMMQNEESRERNQVPCLGGVPVIGAAFSAKINLDEKRNLMIFIRPEIIDTKSEINELTKRQQDIYDYKNTLRNSDEYETTEALDLFNITQTLHPEDEPQEDHGN